MIDAKFFVALAFVIFIGLIWRPVGRFIGKALDARIDKIKAELNEALRLKEEAEYALKDIQAKNRKANEEAEEILSRAKHEANRIISSAQAEMENTIQRRTELALQKISQAESLVIKEMKDNAVDITISAARTIIMENLSRESAEEVLSRAISDIERKFH